IDGPSEGGARAAEFTTASSRSASASAAAAAALNASRSKIALRCLATTHTSTAAAKILPDTSTAPKRGLIQGLPGRTLTKVSDVADWFRGMLFTRYRVRKQGRTGHGLRGGKTNEG
ncbi:hypothetical protein Vafri_329, partial [Volvox africanus]